MEALQLENERIEQVIESCLAEIEKQKELNAQHETEIETLLKFNHRLLNIIQHDLASHRKDTLSLHPISEKSERESDLAPALHSLIRPRVFSPYDRPSCSLIECTSLPARRLDTFGREAIRSEIDHSSHGEKSDCEQNQMQAWGVDCVQGEVARSIGALKQFKRQSSRFYNDKINQIKNLSGKINQFSPAKHLQEISHRLNLSPNTALLLAKVKPN